MAEKIQPTGLPGRWATIRAPITRKAVNASSKARLSVEALRRLPVAAESMKRAVTLMTKTASIDQGAQVDRLPTVASPPSSSWNHAPRGWQCSTARPSRDRYEPRSHDDIGNYAAASPSGDLPTRLVFPWTGLTHRRSWCRRRQAQAAVVLTGRAISVPFPARRHRSATVNHGHSRSPDLR